MIAGLVLKEDVEEESQIAFLGDDESSVQTAGTNQEIIKMVQKKQPVVLACDVGAEQGMKDRTKQEEELEDEGYIFTPASHEPKRVRRMEALKAQLFELMGADRPQIIRFDPQITADELAIHEDDALESYGIDTSDIDSAEQFDAMLGAVTARFYEQNQVKDLGVIVPEPMRD
ncbi:MAG: hypothetical protein ABEI58_02345 [Candidatus Nanohaloarchaea archaeon]